MAVTMAQVPEIWAQVGSPPETLQTLHVRTLPISCTLSAYCILCCAGAGLMRFSHACVRLCVALACCV